MRSGGILAAADRFTIRIHGRATHGSTPHDGVDTVWVAAQVVTALQAVVSRENDARRPLVVSIGTLHAGSRFEHRRERGRARGDRAHARRGDPRRRARAHRPDARRGVPRRTGPPASSSYERVESGDEQPRLAGPVPAIAALRRGLGEAAVRDAEPIMAAEDFAHYGRHVPAFYFFLGVGNPERGLTSYVHTATFQPDESAIAIGVEAACLLLTAAPSSRRRRRQPRAAGARASSSSSRRPSVRPQISRPS